MPNVDPVLAIATYVIVWWLSFLALLPVGVRSLDEAGVNAPGHDQGAPAFANVRKKALWATGIAIPSWALLLGAFYLAYYAR